MDPPDQFGWLLWAATSPYSPLNLHYLPPPIPKDASGDMEDGVFTFEDAFEDLLAVSSGRRLMNIGARYEMRRMLRQMYPHGEDSSFWVRRLHSQRLLDNCNFFPLQPTSLRSFDVLDGFHREFRRAADEARRAEGRGGDEERRRRRGLFDELERLLRSIESHVPGPRARREGEGEADTFDDLYNSLHSAFSQGAKSLTTLIKMARDGVTDIKGQTSWSASSSTSSSSDSGDGTQKRERVESTEEFTDDQGNLHVKRTVRTLDENGKEVGKEVHVRVQSPPPPPLRTEWEEPPQLERPGEKHSDDNSRNNGESSDSSQSGTPGRGTGGDSNRNSRSSSDPNSGWFWK